MPNINKATALYMEIFDDEAPACHGKSYTLPTQAEIPNHSEPTEKANTSSSIRRKQTAMYKIANGKSAGAAQHYVQNKSTAYNMHRHLPTKQGKLKTMLKTVSFRKQTHKAL